MKEDKECKRADTTHKEVGCCGNNCPKPCCESEWTIDDINWAVANSYKNLFIVEKRLLCSSSDLLNNLQYGYSCDDDIYNYIDKLKEIRDTIKREIKRYKHDVRCLCKNDIRNLFEKINRLKKCEIAVKNVTMITDENWVKRNLLCSSREDWEMYSTSLCSLLKLNIKVSKEKILETTCNITFDITKSKEFCDILVSVAIIKYSCDMGLMFDVIKEQCEIEWKLLLEKNPSCDITLQTYISCKEQGLTYDLIELILESGLNVQTKDGELFLQGLLQEYKFNSISFTGMPPNTEETSNFYSNPKEFVNKYLKDYNLSDYTIKKILQK